MGVVAGIRVERTEDVGPGHPVRQRRYRSPRRTDTKLADRAFRREAPAGDKQRVGGADRQARRQHGFEPGIEGRPLGSVVVRAQLVRQRPDVLHAVILAEWRSLRPRPAPITSPACRRLRQLVRAPLRVAGDAATSDPGKQSRAASGIPVVAAFDGFRAYAILGIVLLHTLGFSGVLPVAGHNWFSQLILGTLGQWVDALFVISGFVVFLPTVARGGDFGSVRAYAIRRAARLVPAYWLMLAIVLVLLAAVPLTPALAFPSVAAIGIHMGFLQTPAGMFTDHILMGFGVDGPVWTLSVEIAFYLVLPLVAGWYFRRPILGLVLAAVLTAVWHEAFLHFDAVTSAVGLAPTGSTALRLQVASLLQFPYWAFSFAAGMTGAWAYVRAP